MGFERDASSTFTDEEVPDAGAPPAARYAPGELLGRGAIGEVRAARDTALDRDVAVKVLLREDAPSRERFLREARVTAGLEHPNVLPVHDVGTDADGHTFLVLKRIAGSPLDAWARERPLARRLAVFRQLCDAVSFAHDRGVVHRDLKGANVLVGDHGEVVLADWGVAGPPGPLGGRVLGTPATMAPEVARGERSDERSDGFSLGVVLAELAGGAPLRPGAVDAVLAEARAGTLHVPQLPADLGRIVARATAADPAARYPSVRALQEDLDALAEGRPLPHAGNSGAERAAKWVARNRAAVGVGGVAMFLGAAGIALGAVRYAAEVGAARDAAVASAHRARISESESQLTLSLLRLTTDPDAARASAEAAHATLAELGADLRRAELVRSAVEAAWPSPAVTCETHPGAAVTAIDADPHASRLGAVGSDGRVVLLDPAGCRILAEWALPPGAAAIDLAGGVAATAGPAGWALLDLASGEVRRGPSGLGTPFTADGRVWLRAQDGALLGLPEGPAIPARPDGAHRRPLGDGMLVWNGLAEVPGGLFAADGSPVWSEVGVSRAVGDAARGVALMAGGNHLASVDITDGATRWDRALEGTVGGLTLAAHAPRALWTELGADALHVVALDDGREVARLDVGEPVDAAGIDPAGRVVAVGLASGRVAVYPLREAVETDLGVAHALEVSPSGEVLAWGSDEADAVWLLDLPTRAPLARFGGFPEGVRALAFDPAGARLAVADRAGAVVVVPLGGGEPVRVPVPARPLALLWEPEGLWAGLRDGTLARVDPDGGAVLSAWPAGEDHALWDLSATPLGLVVAGHSPGTPGSPGGPSAPRVVDRAAGAVLAAAAPETTNHYQQAVDAAGRVWVGLETGRVRGWAPNGGPDIWFQADEGPTMGVAVDPASGLLVTGGFRQRLGVHDPATGALLFEGPALGDPATRVVVDGQRTAWTLARGHLRSLPLDAHGAARRVAEALAAGPDPAAFAAAGWWGRVPRTGDPRRSARARLWAGEALPAAEVALLAGR